MFLIVGIVERWRQLPQYSKRFKYLWMLTLVVLLFTAGCVMLVRYGHYNAAEFMSMLGLYNLYTWALAFLFSPTPMGAHSFQHSRVELELEFSDEEPDQDPSHLQ